MGLHFCWNSLVSHLALHHLSFTASFLCWSSWSPCGASWDWHCGGGYEAHLSGWAFPFLDSTLTGMAWGDCLASFPPLSCCRGAQAVVPVVSSAIYSRVPVESLRVRLSGHTAPPISTCGASMPWLDFLHITLYAASSSRREQSFSYLLLDAFLWSISPRLVAFLFSSHRSRVLFFSPVLFPLCIAQRQFLIYYFILKSYIGN